MRYVKAIAAVVCLVFVAACEVPGPQGPAGPQGPEGAPPFGSVVQVRASSNGPRVDARCPENTILIGGGCSCGEGSSIAPKVRAAVMTSLPGAPMLDTYACVCEIGPDGTSGGSSAQAACMYGLTGSTRDAVFVPDLCFSPYSNGCPPPTLAP